MTPEDSQVSSSGPRLMMPAGGTGLAERDLVHPQGRTDTAEELSAAQIRFRRAFSVAYAMWASFFMIDLLVVTRLGAGRLILFAIIRAAVMVGALPVLVRLHRPPTPSRRALIALDLAGYIAPAVGIAMMCVEFDGLASPYAPGLCLVVLARLGMAQDPWQRGLILSGAPVAAYNLVLLASAYFVPRVAAQLHDSAALTMFALHSAYILGTYAFIVVGGHVAWVLKQQVFEARNLGRYRLKRRLATGGMGDVWIAHHPGLRRDVAVKILRLDTQARSPAAVARFEREARATAELAHPNTVRVFDYGVTEDGLWYYVMELLEGETLAAHVARTGPVDPARAVRIAMQASRALTEAHARGIVHRDIKPENLFLTSLGGEHDFIKVLDFGIAKVDDDATMTKTGSVMGTPAYISPEVAVGRVADARSDVYSLGAVLYFLLAARPPFEATTTAALLLARVHSEPSPPSKALGRSLPVDVEAVVMRALMREPEDRFASAAEMAEALASSTTATSPARVAAALAPSESNTPPDATATLDPLPETRRRT